MAPFCWAPAPGSHCPLSVICTGPSTATALGPTWPWASVLRSGLTPLWYNLSRFQSGHAFPTVLRIPKPCCALYRSRSNDPVLCSVTLGHLGTKPWPRLSQHLAETAHLSSGHRYAGMGWAEGPMPRQGIVNDSPAPTPVVSLGPPPIQSGTRAQVYLNSNAGHN